MKQVIRAAGEFGIDFKSFVYPRNNVTHHQTLANNEVISDCGVEPNRPYNDRFFRPIRKGVAFSFGTESPPIIEPTLDEFGLVDSPPSLYFPPSQDFHASSNALPLHPSSSRPATVSMKSSIASRGYCTYYYTHATSLPSVIVSA